MSSCSSQMSDIRYVIGRLTHSLKPSSFNLSLETLVGSSFLPRSLPPCGERPQERTSDGVEQGLLSNGQWLVDFLAMELFHC